MLSAQSLRGEARMEIMMIDTKAIEEHIRGILVALGDDPEREGLKDTPKRVAKMYEEVFLGMNYSNHEIAQMFDKTFEDGIKELDTSKVVVMKDIDLFSYCEHHMALMYDMKATVAYIPNGKRYRLIKDCKNMRYGWKKTAVTGKNRSGYCGHYGRDNRKRGCCGGAWKDITAVCRQEELRKTTREQ